jgi:hypothetical protein
MKRMRTGIDKQKNKKDNYILGCQEREKRRKNKNDSQ